MTERHLQSLFPTFIAIVLIIMTPEYCRAGRFPTNTFTKNGEISGGVELRGGIRVRQEESTRDLSVMDARFQLEYFTSTETIDVKYKADVWADGVTKKGEHDTREAWVFNRSLRNVDLKIGRQVLTWGTGDLVFLNDLFPKDWQSFFIGRADEYLKAPSDAVKCSFFTDFANMDLVYTPRFNPDRYITGTYISPWNKNVPDQEISTNIKTPKGWFKDDEIAFRIYKNIQNYEIAIYGYSGFWKQPFRQDASGKSIFPGLNVYGASIRGQIGIGIGNLEIACYDSQSDSHTTGSSAAHSQMRYLTGYTQELAAELTASVQYYIEQILDDTHDKKKTAISSINVKQWRQVLITRLTKLLMQQTVTLSVATCFSPTDRDVYFRPRAAYQYTDDWVLDAGANIFLGRDCNTFFSQFKNNTSVYVAVRYHF